MRSSRQTDDTGLNMKLTNGTPAEMVLDFRMMLAETITGGIAQREDK